MNQKLRIVVDTREPKYIVTALRASGLRVQRKMLTTGDYVITSDCAIERKTTGDFMSSVFSGRLFKQAQALKEYYSQPILLLEGDIEFELDQRRNPRAFWGALLKLQLDFGIAVMPTPSPLHTVHLLFTLARRLQRPKTEKIIIQHKPRLMSDNDRQIYAVASLPNIGDQTARRLLDHFNTVREVFHADSDEMVKVEGLGKIRAERLKRILDLKYTG